MFARAEKLDQPKETAVSQPVTKFAAPNPNSAPSIISSDLKIVGDVESAGDVQINGVIEGDVHSRSLSIGEEAHVKGSIVAEEVTISGAVTGQVKATTVTIAKTAKVVGDVFHKSLSIEAGATMEGRLSQSEFDKAGGKSTVTDLGAARAGFGAPSKGGDTPPSGS